MLRLLLHLDFDERRPGRHLVFGGHDRSVTDERRRQAVNAGLHLLDLEPPERIGHGALTGLAGDRNGCIGDRFPGKTVDNPAPAQDTPLRPKQQECTIPAKRLLPVSSFS